MYIYDVWINYCDVICKVLGMRAAQKKDMREQIEKEMREAAKQEREERERAWQQRLKQREIWDLLVLE